MARTGHQRVWVPVSCICTCMHVSMLCTDIPSLLLFLLLYSPLHLPRCLPLLSSSSFLLSVLSFPLLLPPSIPSINIKPHVDFIKKAVGASNPAVRTSAINLLGVIHMYIGAQLRVFFEEEKAALLQQIDAAFEKVSVWGGREGRGFLCGCM